MGNKKSVTTKSNDKVISNYDDDTQSKSYSSLMKILIPINKKMKRFPIMDQEYFMSKMIRLKDYKLSSKTGFLEEYLPEEIMIQILDYLPLQSLIKLRTVSRNFKDFWIQFPALWKKFSKPQKMMYIPVMYDVDYLDGNEFKLQFLKSLREYSGFRYSHQVKVLVIGDKKCGKTSYHNRAFKDDPLSDQYIYTIGVDYFTKTVCNNLMIQSWDTAGEERFRTITKSFYRGINAHFYCFDLNNHSSFENAKLYFNEWKQDNGIGANECSYFMENNNICALFLGFKSDLERNVTREEVHEFLEELEPERNKMLHTSRVQYFELSSMKDSSSDLFFPYLYAAAILTINWP